MKKTLKYSVSVVTCYFFVLIVAVAAFQQVTAAHAYPESDLGIQFVTTIDNEDVEIGLGGNLSGVVINWGDGEPNTVIPDGTNVADTFYRHSYPLAGTYTATISGTTLGHFGKCGAAMNTWNLKKILSWGDLGTTSLECAAYTRSGMTEVPATLPPTVTNLDYAFWDTHVFDQNLSGWETQNVTTMESMFSNALIFNNAGVPFTWKTAHVINMVNMFSNAAAFNRDISSWDVSSVATMAGMFSGASAFDHSLGGWNVTRVSDMSTMLVGAGMSDQNYSLTLQGWATQSVQHNIVLGADFLSVVGCDAANARASLISAPPSWTVVDATTQSPCPVQDVVWTPTNTSSTAKTLTPNVMAVGSDDGVVSYRVTSAGTSGCTVNSVTGVISSQAVGSCVVTATAAQTAGYASGSTSVEFTFVNATSSPGLLASTGAAEISWSLIIPSAFVMLGGFGILFTVPVLRRRSDHKSMN